MKTKRNTRHQIPLFLVRRRRPQLDGQSAVDLRMQVWLLRILATLGGHRLFFDDGTFTCDDDALLLGFDPCDDDLTRKSFIAQLQQQLQQAERNWKQAAKPPAATLDANLAAIQRLLGCSDAERSVLEFLVLMEHSPRLGLFVSEYLPSSVDAYRAISVLTGISQQAVKAALRPQGVLCSSGFVSIDDPKDCSLPSGIQLLTKEFSDQMATQPMNPAGLLANKVQLAPQARLTLRDYPHNREQLDILLPYLQPAQALRLLHRHCELLRLPQPESADEHALQRLRNLTPGDFAAVLRQHRFRPLPCAADWVKALQGECALKSDACRAPLGFVG